MPVPYTLCPVPDITCLKGHSAYGEKPVIVLAPRNNLLNKLTNEQVEVLPQDRNIIALKTMPGLSDDREQFFYVCPFEKYPHQWLFMYSHNISVPTAVLRTVDGFDEALAFWGYDDMELGYRLWKEKLDFVYDKNCGGTHLYHSPSKTKDWDRNLRIIYKKRPCPEIELLFIEYRLNTFERYRVYSNCDREKLMLKITACELAGDYNFAPGNTILNCLTVQGNSYPVLPGLGIFNENKKYVNSISSHRLMQLGMAGFAVIMEEMQLISDNIYIYDPGKEIEKELVYIHKCNPDRQFAWDNGFWQYRYADTGKFSVHFISKSMSDMDLMDFRYAEPAEYYEKHDQSTMIYKLDEDIVTNGDYLKPGYEFRYLNHILHNNKTFVIHQPYGKKEAGKYLNPVFVFWDDLPFVNKEVFAMLDEFYDVLIFTNEKDLKLYKEHSGRQPRTASQNAQQ